MSPEDLPKYLAKGQELFNRIAALPMPTVAAINGDCLGGGFELALACRHRVAADDGSINIGLPETNPTAETYQLWIIDSRGMEQRVSGGVFSGGAGGEGGEVIVPIDPALAIKGAGAFAVTIEPPGGNAVSDMKRRVVIAAKP